MIVYHGDVLTSGTLSGTGERVGFPMTNVTHPHLSRVWRSLALSSESIMVDAGVGLTLTADSAAVVAHNLTAAATAKVEASDDGTWGSPVLSQAFDPTQDPALTVFTSQAHRFWRFIFTDAGNPDAYIEIGRLMLSVRADLGDIDTGLQLSLEDSTVVSRSATGQKFADLGPQARVYGMSLGHMDNATRLAIEELYAEVGQRLPVIVQPHRDILALYATLEKTVITTQAGGWLWTDDGLRFMEAF